MLEKNQLCNATVTDITFEGNGVCRVNGMTVFVPNTAVGDEIRLKVVKVLKSYAFGTVDEIIVPSAERIETDCPHYKKCGGCVFRHISYSGESDIKSNIVRNSFTRIGGLTPEFEEFLPCENVDGYRNKAQYPIAVVDGKAVCGFFSPRSHRVVPIEHCLLQPTVFGQICSDILDFINRNHISVYNEAQNNGFARHIFIRQGYHTKEIMVCLVVRKDISRQLKPLCAVLESKYPNVKSIVMNINPDRTNVIMGRKCTVLAGADHITDFMCGNKITLSPLSFYQVNTAQAEKLYAIAREFAELKSGMNVVDLYCGTGTIGLSMAKDTDIKLTGIEIIREAAENAQNNAVLNNIFNANFICGDAGEALKKVSGKVDLIFLDPPRKGCDTETVKAVAAAQPKRIVMISCSPSTAARDCKLFEELGYSLVKARGVDMFPRTGHVEAVMLLVKV